MSIISLLVVLVLVGMGLYVVNTVIPMDAKVKQILNVVVVVLLVLWLLEVFGLFPGGPYVIGHGHR